MDTIDPPQLDVLRAYSTGQLGTREAIERAGVHDYADLIIGLAQNDLVFPRPKDTAAHKANVERATAILQPLLRRGR